MRIRIKRDYDLTPEIAERLEEKLDQVVRKIAFEIQGDAQAAAPVDTSALRNSINVVTHNMNQYSAAVARAASLRPEAKFATAITECAKAQAFIQVPIHYGIFHEFGFYGRPGRKFLGKAVRGRADIFEAAVTHVVQTAGQGF